MLIFVKIFIMPKKNVIEITSKTCEACKAICCRHIALPIDKPTTKKEYDYIRWYLMHENVNVYIDYDKEWMIEFKTPCRHLGKDYKCKNYNGRPDICRKYPEKNQECEYLSDTPCYKIMFHNVDEFEKYLKRKKINWRFHSHK